MSFDCKRMKSELRAGLSQSASMTVGESPVDVMGIGLEYLDLREYRYGDDVRRVDWRASARSVDERLFVKVYRVERRVQVNLVVDLTSSMGFKEKPFILARALGIVLGLAEKLKDVIRPVVLADRVRVYPLMGGEKASYLLLKEACSGFRGGLTLGELRLRRSVIFTDPAQPLEEVDRARRMGASLFLVTSKGELGLPVSGIGEVGDLESGLNGFYDLNEFSTAVRIHLNSIKALLGNRGALLTEELVRRPLSVALPYVRWTRGGVSY